jgi:hypothetical protein
MVLFPLTAFGIVDERRNCNEQAYHRFRAGHKQHHQIMMILKNAKSRFMNSYLYVCHEESHDCTMVKFLWNGKIEDVVMNSLYSKIITAVAY